MIRQSQKQEGQFASFEDTAAHLPQPFVVEAPGRWRGNRTGPIGDQTEKLHPHAIRRLYLAIIKRAILDVLENGQELREAKRWLLSRDFDSLQAATKSILYMCIHAGFYRTAKGNWRELAVTV